MDGWLKTEDQALPLDPTYLLVLEVDKNRKAETGIVAVNLYSEICLVPYEETERKQHAG